MFKELKGAIRQLRTWLKYKIEKDVGTQVREMLFPVRTSEQPHGIVIFKVELGKDQVLTRELLLA